MPPVIGRYQILARLAQDWVDEVYRGYDPMIQRPVAVKVFRLKLDDPAAAIAIKQGFYGEMQRTGGLTHHGIAALFDAGEIAGGIFMATEYVEGTSLAQLFTDGLPADLVMRVSLVSQIADALDYAHQAGVLHLNLKPTTVLVGSDYTVKVSAFGVASVLNALAAATNLTLPASRYVAPERASGGAGDARSDVYSLACLARDVLAEPADRTDAGGGVPSLPPSLAERGVDADRWRDVFARGLAADPAARHETPGAFKMELLLAVGVGETEAQLAWDTSRATGSATSESGDDSQTVLSPSSSYPPPIGLHGPSNSSQPNPEEPETMLTPLPEPARRPRPDRERDLEESATRLVEPTETRMVDPQKHGGDPHAPKR